MEVGSVGPLLQESSIEYISPLVAVSNNDDAYIHCLLYITTVLPVFFLPGPPLVGPSDIYSYLFRACKESYLDNERRTRVWLSLQSHSSFNFRVHSSPT